MSNFEGKLMSIPDFSEETPTRNRKLYSIYHKNYLKNLPLKTVNALSAPDIADIHVLYGYCDFLRSLYSCQSWSPSPY